MKELLEHHVKEEEGLFKAAAKLGTGRLKELGREMETQRVRRR